MNTSVQMLETMKTFEKDLKMIEMKQQKSQVKEQFLVMALNIMSTFVDKHFPNPQAGGEVAQFKTNLLDLHYLSNLLCGFPESSPQNNCTPANYHEHMSSLIKEVKAMSQKEIEDK